MSKQQKIFITGGHLTPALAVVDEIIRQKLPWEILFIGRTYALEGSSDTSKEYEEIQKRHILFLPLVAGRISRVFTFWSLVSWVKIPFGFLQAFWYVVLYRPDFILTFGGYIAFPVALAGWICHIPIITHEQTMRMGLANKMISIMAKKVLVSFEQTIPNNHISKYVMTGLPIRHELFSPPSDPSFSISDKTPVLYITGGSTGAVTLNELLFPLIEKLITRYIVIHQTGVSSFHTAEQLKITIPKPGQNRYIISPHFGVSDVAWIYKHADMVIGRSGANTVCEMAAFGKIALLVPLPWSANGEQLENANWLARDGGAYVVMQKDANSVSIYNALTSLWSNRKTLGVKAHTLSIKYSADGAAKIVDVLAHNVLS